MASFEVTLIDDSTLTVVDVDAYSAGEYVSGVCQSAVKYVRTVSDDAPVYGVWTDGEGC